jgi:nicotinamide phosphoribosyltransferase
MVNYNPLLMIDFYKATHAEQYPEDMKLIYSPYTPRMTRLKDTDKVTYFGGQMFAKEYLINAFNELFFSRPEEEVVAEYERTLTYTLGPGSYTSDKIRNLHRLGYLPIAMYAVPEGTRTKVGVPQSVFVNTDPDFAWLTNTLETAYSCFMWHIQISAEVGYRYRQIVEKYRDLTCDEDVRTARLLGDFSMRGQHSPESAMKSSMGWLLSFLNTATVPAIMAMEDYYNCDITKEEVGFGAISTEHSVMCSNFAVDGDEITHIKRLLTEIYPNNSFSMVSDSYDYWRLVTEILPQCKTEIENHNGYLAIRGDSGDPVEVIAGKKIEFITPYDDEEAEKLFTDTRYTVGWLYEYCRDREIEENCKLYFNFIDKLYEVSVSPDWTNERGAWTDNKYYYVDDYDFIWEVIDPTAEIMGTVWALDQIFGHTINSKGFKVLPPYIKAIYGDSITPQRCEEIYSRLAEQGYAINNVSLGVGSFSFMCLETIDNEGNTHYNPYTRDTFGIAIKATYGELSDYAPVNIFKNPKALSWKKSQKGCIIVAPDGQSYTDEHTYTEAHHPFVENLLEIVFLNGEMVKEQSLSEIRNRLYPGGF